MRREDLLAEIQRSFIDEPEDWTDLGSSDIHSTYPMATSHFRHNKSGVVVGTADSYVWVVMALSLPTLIFKGHGLLNAAIHGRQKMLQSQAETRLHDALDAFRGFRSFRR